jgi:hypothetical protein
MEPGRDERGDQSHHADPGRSTGGAGRALLPPPPPQPDKASANVQVESKNAVLACRPFMRAL